MLEKFNMKSTARYHRLADKVEDGRPVDTYHSNIIHGQAASSCWIVVLSTLLLGSVVLNVVLLDRAFSQSLTTGKVAPGLSLYAELPEDVQMRFEMETEYSSTNLTLADSLWDSISTSHGAVALTDEYVKAKGLRPARRFPWDESKGLYHVQGVHLMHCVKIIRRSHLEYARGLPQSLDEWHTRHCFDALRMGIMCSASDTPLPTQYPPLDTGVGQMLQCRSWDRLRDWALAPERNACFAGAEENLAVKGWERYGQCPPGSPYQEIVDGALKKNRTEGDEESGQS